jgi:hypothetical protein
MWIEMNTETFFGCAGIHLNPRAQFTCVEVD